MDVKSRIAYFESSARRRSTFSKGKHNFSKSEAQKDHRNNKPRNNSKKLIYWEDGLSLKKVFFSSDCSDDHEEPTETLNQDCATAKLDSNTQLQENGNYETKISEASEDKSKSKTTTSYDSFQEAKSLQPKTESLEQQVTYKENLRKYVLETLVYNETLKLRSEHLRCAFLVGCDSYHEHPLKHCVKNMKSLKNSLERIGFITCLVSNGSQAEIQNRFRQFLSLIRQRYEGSKVLCFFVFSGYAVQHRGENFLLPCDFRDFDNVSSVKYNAIHLPSILHGLNMVTEQANGVYVVALDYFQPFLSRNILSLTSSSNSPSSVFFSTGLAPEFSEHSTESFIAFSGSPHKPTSDAAQYTFHLSNIIDEGKKRYLEQIFKEVKRRVYVATDGVQVPWENSSVCSEVLILPQPQDTRYHEILGTAVDRAKEDIQNSSQNEKQELFHMAYKFSELQQSFDRQHLHLEKLEKQNVGLQSTITMLQGQITRSKQPKKHSSQHEEAFRINSFRTRDKHRSEILGRHLGFLNQSRLGQQQTIQSVQMSLEEEMLEHIFWWNGLTWKMVLFPQGYSEEAVKQQYCSMFLVLCEEGNYKPLDVKFRFSIRSRQDGTPAVHYHTNWLFESFEQSEQWWGFDRAFTFEQVEELVDCGYNENNKRWLWVDICLDQMGTVKLCTEGKYTMSIMVDNRIKYRDRNVLSSILEWNSMKFFLEVFPFGQVNSGEIQEEDSWMFVYLYFVGLIENPDTTQPKPRKQRSPSRASILFRKSFGRKSLSPFHDKRLVHSKISLRGSGASYKTDCGTQHFDQSSGNDWTYATFSPEEVAAASDNQRVLVEIQLSEV